MPLLLIDQEQVRVDNSAGSQHFGRCPSTCADHRTFAARVFGLDRKDAVAQTPAARKDNGSGFIAMTTLDDTTSFG